MTAGKNGAAAIVRTALVTVLLVAARASPVDNGSLTIRILHTNDMHSRFEEVSASTGICSAKESREGRCYGGFARLATLVRRAREDAKTGTPTFFLNAGDTFLGSKLFSYYKWKIVARFLNILRPDAASLGNHEFDKRISGLVPYLNNITFPIVAANLDVSAEPLLQQAKQLKKSTVLYAKNRKIGVIGYLTTETKELSQTGNVIFMEEVMSIRQEAKLLKYQGCDIIIAVGHSGYVIDQKIAREVEDVDLVIGGHTNTFLYTGQKPDREIPEGLYPTVVVQPSGRKTYVVQAYMATKYMGDITVEFDSKGEITKIQGNPILVDYKVPKAQDVEDELKIWAQPLANLSTMVLGDTKVYLEGDEKVCRLTECNLGNFVTDALIYYNANRTVIENGWTDASIAVYQAGGIRTSIEHINDQVTMDDVLASFPFGTKAVKVDMTGALLKQLLEFSVHDRITQNITKHGGMFLQLSGLQVTYDISKPVDSRVVCIKARCSMCVVPSYQDIDMGATYRVIVNDFLHSGGDGYIILKDLPAIDMMMNDVIYAALNPKQLQTVFAKEPLMNMPTLRAFLERVVLSSIMKLDDNSMNKLFDLMIMMVKYQLVTATGPREVILSTLNHLDAIRDMTLDGALSEYVEFAHRFVVDTYGGMARKEIWQIRNDCLHEIQEHSVRVSILLRLGLQNQDASFNRLVQRYDEKYRERREILQDVKLLDSSAEVEAKGSLALYGDRVTLLGQNVYASSYGQVQNTDTRHNIQDPVIVSNRTMCAEFDALATQLGKEETVPKRPFTLHLFTHDDNEKGMDCCTPSEMKFDRTNVAKDEEGNVNNYGNLPINQYKKNLIDNINSEFSDNDASCTEATDLMNFFEVM